MGNKQQHPAIARLSGIVGKLAEQAKKDEPVSDADIGELIESISACFEIMLVNSMQMEQHLRLIRDQLVNPDIVEMTDL